MPFKPDIHHRQSIRLQGYDYSHAGLYFVTICAWQWQPLFGEIIDGEMVLNTAGKIAYEEWRKTKIIRQDIKLHEYVIMPNHFHGVVEIVGARLIAPGADMKVSNTPDKSVGVQFIASMHNKINNKICDNQGVINHALTFIIDINMYEIKHPSI